MRWPHTGSKHTGPSAPALNSQPCLSLSSATCLSPPQAGGHALQRMLIVAPVSVLENWEEEFYKWLKPLPSRQRLRGRLFAMDQPTTSARIAVLKKWQAEGGVLFCGFERFERCSNGVGVRSSRVKSELKRYLVSPGLWRADA